MLDKAAISLLVAVIATAGGNEIYAVAVTFIAFSLSMLTFCTDRRRTVIAASGIYILLCLLEPRFCYGLPVIVYDVARLRNVPLSAVAAAAMLLAFAETDTGMAFLCLVGIVASIVTELKTERLELAEKGLIETRDNSEEINMLLTEKNRNLIRLRDYEVYTAKLKERNRIAREIHDNVGHILTRCLLQMGALLVVTKDEQQRENLESIRQSIDGAMTSIRQSVHDLHDDSIDMGSSVRELIKSLPKHFSASFDYGCGENSPREIKLAFLGIIKEALNNIAKHSSGDRVHISIRENPAFYRLTVVDNGANPTAVNPTPSGGIGLENMRSRTESLGGILRIESSDEGFKVFASIPKSGGYTAD